MNGMPKPGEQITMEDGARRIAELGAMARQYPIGQPHDVTVTLTDEQWVAIQVALGSIVVHAATMNAPNPFPAWVDEKQREALEAIWAANMAHIIEHGVNK